MIRILPLLFVALVLPQGAQANPLQTAACRAALSLLSQEEDAVIARRSGGAPDTAKASSRLAPLQREAARVCLGERLDVEPKAPRVPTLQPSTPPRPLPVPAGSQVQPALPGAMARPAVPQRPLVTISQCDSQGCWASDGTRLQKHGPLLLGPRGHCSLAGAVVDCP